PTSSTPSARRTPPGQRSGRPASGPGSPSPAAWSSCTAAPSRRAVGAKATGRRSSSCCRWQLPMYELWRTSAKPGDREREAKSATKLAAVEYITKPIEVDYLLQQVEHYCRPGP